MAAPAGSKVSFFSFTRPFYVMNGIELLERGAFYSMNYVLAAYFILTAGIPAADMGTLASILFLLLYVVPLIGAPFAEKYGYKAALFVSFALLTAGYASLFYASANPGFWTLFLSISLIGFGAGIFKPIAAAVVSQTSTEDQRNMAFMIYYGAINLGATLVPLGIVVADLFVEGTLALMAFGVAATLSFLNFVLIATTWRNIQPAQKDKSVLQSLAALGSVFRYPKFLLLLVIYSGFWFLYAMSLSFLPVYMLEFGRMPSWFNELVLGVVNPGVIVIAAPLVGAFTRSVKSLHLMVAGIALYVVGFLTVGFSATPWLFLLGVAIFSIGEVVTHPSFLSYVSKVSPPDKVSVFLSYGFLPIAVGLFFGARVGGQLYQDLAQEAGEPALFWAIMSAVALVAVAALLVYNRFITPREERQRSRGIGGAAGTFGLAALALLMVPALVIAGAAMPNSNAAVGTGGGDALDAASLTTATLPEITGTASEDAAGEVRFTLPDSATGRAVLTLTWTDEAGQTAAHTNAPDTLKMVVTLPDGTTVESEEAANTVGGEGTIELVLEDAVPGAYTVSVEAVSCGDTSVASPLVPLGGAPDTGNDFTLVVEHQTAAA